MWPACGRRASVLNIHVQMIHATRHVVYMRCYTKKTWYTHAPMRGSYARGAQERWASGTAEVHTSCTTPPEGAPSSGWAHPTAFLRLERPSSASQHEPIVVANQLLWRRQSNRLHSNLHAFFACPHPHMHYPCILQTSMHDTTLMSSARPAQSPLSGLGKPAMTFGRVASGFRGTASAPGLFPCPQYGRRGSPPLARMLARSCYLLA